MMMMMMIIIIIIITVIATQNVANLQRQKIKNPNHFLELKVHTQYET